MADVALSYAAIEQLPNFMGIMTKAYSGPNTDVHYSEESPAGMRDSIQGSSVRAYRHAQDSHDGATAASGLNAACDLGTLWFARLRAATAGAAVLRGAGGVISSEETNEYGHVTASLEQGSLVESFADLGMDYTMHSPLKKWGAVAYLEHDATYAGPSHEDAGVVLDGDVSAGAAFHTILESDSTANCAACSAQCTDAKAKRLNSTDAIRVNTDARYEFDSVSLTFCGFTPTGDATFSLVSTDWNDV